MRFFRKIININNLILIGAILPIPFGVRQCREIFDDFTKLEHHKGVVAENVVIDIEEVSSGGRYNKKYQRKIAKIKLIDDSTIYSVSKYAERIKNLVQPGDSVELYTKPITSVIGNFVSGEGSIWNTHNPNELFHLTSNQYNTLIDFNRHHNSLKNSMWVSPLMSLVFLGWYFYRRSGKKSMLIIES